MQITETDGSGSDPKLKAATPVIRVPETEAEAKARAERESLYERRRSSLSGGGGGSRQEASARADDAPRPSAPPRRRTAMVGVVFLVLVGAGAGAFFGLRHFRATTPEGRVRHALGAYELAGRDAGKRDAAFAEIDKLGPAGVDLVVVALTDTEKVDQDGNRSDRAIQQMANAYLLRVASNAKIDPPPVAIEIRKVVYEGGMLPAAKWTELQGAWRAWIDAARGKGALPKA